MTALHLAVSGSAGDTSTGWENYAYDYSGALVQKDQNDGSTTRYGYDGAGQITWEQRAGGNPAIPAYAEGYTYDANSNRLSKTLTDATHASAVDWYTYQPNSDRLDHVSGGIVGSRAYTYDTNGDVRSINANGQSVWLSTDYNGMPFRIDYNTGPGQGSVYATMAYNGLNQRLFYHDANGVNHYNGYDGAEPGAALLFSSGMLFTPAFVSALPAMNAAQETISFDKTYIRLGKRPVHRTTLKAAEVIGCISPFSHERQHVRQQGAVRPEWKQGCFHDKHFSRAEQGFPAAQGFQFVALYV